MATATIAHSAHQSTLVDRIAEGRGLYAELGHTFTHARGAWLIPSRTVEGRVYEVRLEPVETCECKDYEFRGVKCAHIIAGSIAQAKSRVCSCCGHRVLGRFLSEVTEDDALLSWFIGDELCSDCIKDGYWA
jgi:hypothetical protein